MVLCRVLAINVVAKQFPAHLWLTGMAGMARIQVRLLSTKGRLGEGVAVVGVAVIGGLLAGGHPSRRGAC